MKFKKEEINEWITLLFKMLFIRELDSQLYESGKSFFGIRPYLLIRLTIMSH